MTNYLDKEKLLEWLEVEVDLSQGNNPVLKADRWAFQHIKEMVKRGKFDVKTERENQK